MRLTHTSLVLCRHRLSQQAVSELRSRQESACAIPDGREQVSGFWNAAETVFWRGTLHEAEASLCRVSYTQLATAAVGGGLLVAGGIWLANRKRKAAALKPNKGVSFSRNISQMTSLGFVASFSLRNEQCLLQARHVQH